MTKEIKMRIDEVSTKGGGSMKRKLIDRYEYDRKICEEDVIRNRPLDNCYKVFETFIKSRNKVIYTHIIRINNNKKGYVFANTTRTSPDRIKELEHLALNLKSKIECMIDAGLTNQDFDDWYQEREWKTWK